MEERGAELRPVAPPGSQVRRVLNPLWLDLRFDLCRTASGRLRTGFVWQPETGRDRYVARSGDEIYRTDARRVGFCGAGQRTINGFKTAFSLIELKTMAPSQGLIVVWQERFN